LILPPSSRVSRTETSQDRVVLSKAGESFAQALPSLIKPKAKAAAAAPPTSPQAG